MGQFTDVHRAVLDFERTLWTHAGAKDAAIREQLDMSPTRYWQLVNWAIDQPEALEHHAPTVRRLQRLRDARRELRAG